MKVSLSIQTSEVENILPLALLAGTFEKKCEFASQIGANGLELITTDPNRLDPNYIRSILKKFNLAATAISSGGISRALGLTLLNPNPETAKQAFDKLIQLIRFAMDIQAPVVTIGSFRGRLAENPKENKKKLIDILHQAGDYAKKGGTTLAIEPLNRYETDFLYNTQQGLDFLESVDHPCVGLLFDIFHANIEEASFTEPLTDAMKARRLFHVHVADNNRLAPGYGMIQFRNILRTLKELKYSGAISAELLPKPDPDTAARQTVTLLKKIINGN